jgi:ubiquinone/menaquinone biosynthesis C-methylase UbiE
VDGLRQTQDHYDRLSRWYDLLSGPAERQYTLAGVELLRLQPGERVLEIGFGTGHALLAMAQQVGETGRVTGIDLSQGMAAAARERVRRAGQEGRIRLVRGDGRALPFHSGEWDAVFLSFTLELFPDVDLALVLGECQRALVSGGRIAVVTLAKPEQPHCGAAVYEWLHRRFPRALDCRPIQAQDWLRRAGFAIEALQRPVLMHILPIEIVLGRKG